MKIGFKTIYRWIYKNIIIKGDVKKLRRKGKSLKSKETRGKFNIGKSIKNRPLQGFGYKTPTEALAVK